MSKDTKKNIFLIGDSIMFGSFAAGGEGISVPCAPRPADLFFKRYQEKAEKNRI